ncbi:MAG: hypothetical protein LBM71_04570 [Elusimicrobiota bacterium]|jgi:hypothetical protein|nr:hypothetical protein [Elusimicrobiota bacterium]
MKKVEIALSGLASALNEYQLIHGKGTYPTDPTKLPWGLPESCNNEKATLSTASGWPLLWPCGDFYIGFGATGASTGIVSAVLGFKGGNGGHYDRYANGSFHCRLTSGADAKAYKKYCEINNLPIDS